MTDEREQRFTCPACGYPDLREEPWTEEGGGSQEICPACKIQFGYDDAAGGDSEKRKRIWRDWPKPNEKPFTRDDFMRDLRKVAKPQNEERRP